MPPTPPRVTARPRTPALEDRAPRQAAWPLGWDPLWPRAGNTATHPPRAAAWSSVHPDGARAAGAGPPSGGADVCPAPVPGGAGPSSQARGPVLPLSQATECVWGKQGKHGRQAPALGPGGERTHRPQDSAPRTQPPSPLRTQPPSPPGHSPLDSAQQAQPHRKEQTERLTGRWRVTRTGSRTEITGQEVKAIREPRAEGQVGTGGVAGPSAPAPEWQPWPPQRPRLHGDSSLPPARPTLLTLW